MAATAIPSTRLLSASSAWPRTQCHFTRWRAAAASRACQSSTFLTGSPDALRQPLRFQPASQLVMPLWTYCESVNRSTLQGCLRALRPSIAAIISMRLLVVCASPPETSFSTPPNRSSAAQPPGPGFPAQAPSV
jgi:hypothetical protein